MVYLETSAKEFKNVENAFELVAKGVLDRIDSGTIEPKNEVGL